MTDMGAREGSAAARQHGYKQRGAGAQRKLNTAETRFCINQNMVRN